MWGHNSEITFSRKELVSDMGGTWKNKGADKEGLFFWPFMLQKAQPFWPCFCVIPLFLMSLEWKLYVSKCWDVWWFIHKMFFTVGLLLLHDVSLYASLCNISVVERLLRNANYNLLIFSWVKVMSKSRSILYKIPFSQKLPFL